MLIVLVFVLIYYCCIPVYRGMQPGMQRQKQREEEQQDWENDPRWNRERFSFVPRRPKNFMEDKKYSRLAACSRTSSMRSDVQGMRPEVSGAGQCSNNNNNLSNV